MNAPDSENIHILWDASEQYVRGQINSERLEEIELPNTLRRQDAMEAVTFWRLRWFFAIIIAILFILATLFSFLLFIITKNPFGSLAILAPLQLGLRPLIRYVFPKNENDYRIEAAKIHEKMLKKRKKLKRY